MTIDRFAGIEDRIEEAQKHTGLLNGRELLTDVVRLVREVKGLSGDLQYSRKRADEADKEVARLNAEAKDRAAELRRRDRQLVDLRVRVGESGPPTVMKLSAELVKSRAKVEDLEAEVKRLKPKIPEEIPETDAANRESCNEWKIWQGRSLGGSHEKWWCALGEGYTADRRDAHHYTWEHAKELLRTRPVLELQMVHPTEASPADGEPNE